MHKRGEICRFFGVERSWSAAICMSTFEICKKWQITPSYSSVQGPTFSEPLQHFYFFNNWFNFILNAVQNKGSNDERGLNT